MQWVNDRNYSSVFDETYNIVQVNIPLDNLKIQITRLDFISHYQWVLLPDWLISQNIS